MDKLLARFFRVKPTEVILFYRQLALLLESGMDIVTSLELLQGQSSSRTLKRVLNDIISDLRSGNQLSASLSKHPEIFSPIYCRLLGVGEQTGGLETILRQIADYMENEVTRGKSIKNALMYPVMAFIAAIVVVGILVTFILPAFSSLYSSLGADLPALTQILISVTEKLRSYGIYILFAVLTAVSLTFAYIKTPDGRYKWHGLLLKLPLVGRATHLSELARCCRSMSLLFHAGLPLTEIIPLVVQSSNNKAIARALIDVQQDMLKGEGLSQPMTKNPLFLPLMVQMVGVGEETGKLDSTLSSVAQNYETEAQDKTRRLIGLIQPTMTLIIGGMIGFIALSMISAMYSIYGQVL